jgi:hypothetical protein
LSDTVQFHGAADRLRHERRIYDSRRCFRTPTTGTQSPAVTIASVGTHGGQAAAFTFDLAVDCNTRQGNPAWSGQERDAISPIRSDDLFFGAAAATSSRTGSI